MDEEKKLLIEKARKIHKNIYLPGRKTSFDDCFTRHNNKLIFWFNKEDQSTNVLVHELRETQNVAS